MGRALPLLWHTTTFASSLFFIIWSVLAIELTLTWNDTQGIYNISSTGQLIPFIVGLAGLLKTLFALFLVVWKKARNLFMLVFWQALLGLTILNSVLRIGRNLSRKFKRILPSGNIGSLMRDAQFSMRILLIEGGALMHLLSTIEFDC